MDETYIKYEIVSPTEAIHRMEILDILGIQPAIGGTETEDKIELSYTSNNQLDQQVDRADKLITKLVNAELTQLREEYYNGSRHRRS